jgi:uncharacterized membrane protein
MNNTELLIAVMVAVLIGVGVIVSHKKGVKMQLALLIASTAYMLVHAILHPESNSKFFVFIGLVFIVQTFKKIKGQSQT